MVAAIAGVFGVAPSACAFRLYTVGGDADCSFPDIQSAINNATDADGNSVLIARSGTYANQHLVINGQNINLLGGLDNCSSSQYSGQTTIHGTSGFSVIEIEGTSTVYLGNLFIRDGHLDANHSGGGIYFGGQGSLALANSAVSLNTAGYGGGIDFNGGTGPATLTLDSDTLILSNTAFNDGGGIRVEGDARLFALQPQTLIEFNHAPNGNGGGIAVIGPATADIGSPGYNGSPVLQFNDAQNGGAIAVLATANGSGTVRLFTTDPQNPVQVSNNSASTYGGAVYLKSRVSVSGTSDAAACVFDYRIDENIAPEGAAFYAGWDSGFLLTDEGSILFFNPDGLCGPEAPAALGAVACAPGVACNEVSGNVAADANNQPTDGAVILVGSNSRFVANRLILRSNAAAYAINVVGDDTGGKDTKLANCLIVDNHTQHELIGVRRSAGTNLYMDGCTLAHNTIDNGYVLYGAFSVSLTLTDSIIDMPGVQTLDGTNYVPTVRYVLSNDTSTLPASHDVVQGEASFVDSANGDYHLLPTSLGIDFAPNAGGRDLDRLPRDVDLPQVPNVFGPRDLGAYERQFVCAADTIFCSGFEMYQ